MLLLLLLAVREGNVPLQLRQVIPQVIGPVLRQLVESLCGGGRRFDAVQIRQRGVLVQRRRLGETGDETATAVAVVAVTMKEEGERGAVRFGRVGNASVLLGGRGCVAAAAGRAAPQQEVDRLLVGVSEEPIVERGAVHCFLFGASVPCAFVDVVDVDLWPMRPA